jgi:hypothetical protein
MILLEYKLSNISKGNGISLITISNLPEGTSAEESFTAVTESVMVEFIIEEELSVLQEDVNKKDRTNP